MINFKLRHIDECQPAGSEDDLQMSWFWLTDGDLWIDLESSTLYEYSPEALKHFGNPKSPYNDYPIARFIEDFTALFGQINESIPDNIYAITEDLEEFLSKAQQWLDLKDTDEENDFYFDAYDPLIAWTYHRTLNSGHLIGGPHLSFFRNGDKIRIVWKTEFKLDNGIELWTAKNGSVEMAYEEFISVVRDFGKKFFKAMKMQVHAAVEKDWKNISLDKHKLVEEQQERESNFWKQFALLETESPNETDWKQIYELNLQMTSTLS